MTASQTLNNVYENNFDDDISITEIPKGHFPAVTSNTIQDGSNTREITVDIFSLEQSTGGTMVVNSGLYMKRADETQVKVTVKQNGNQVADNTQTY